MLKEINSIFRKQFSDNPRLFRAPGRINIIGEHTDYNSGFVLPAAIDKELFFAIAPNNLKKFRFFAYNFSDFTEITSVKKQKNKTWTNYLLGIIDQLNKQNINIDGVDLVFGGNIPTGAGLSSSAALECGFLYALNSIYNLNLSQWDIAKMSQKAEHEFIGVKCGIMDQFASLFGKSNNVIKLDCRSLEYNYFPFDFDNYRLLLCNSNVKHTLASSEYNTRRNECETGVNILAKKFNSIKSLRDATTDMIEEMKPQMSDKVYTRCKYVVEENLRVENVCQLLQNNDIISVGKKMFETHKGLKDEYEVSCPEIDQMIEIAQSIDGVIGARMIGGGFGGCTLNLIHEDEIPVFVSTMQNKFYKNKSAENSIYTVSIKNGVSEIK